jgi:hypothetical protein
VNRQTFELSYYLQLINNLFGRYLSFTIHFESLGHRVQSVKKIHFVSRNFARAEKLRKFSKQLAGELMIVLGCLTDGVKEFHKNPSSRKEHLQASEISHKNDPS